MLTAFFTLVVLGAPGPDLSLRDAQGAEWRLADRNEAIVVVVFLGAECPLGKLYAPRLAELAQEYEGAGVAFVGVNANAYEDAADVARFLGDHPLPFPVLKD